MSVKWKFTHYLDKPLAYRPDKRRRVSSVEVGGRKMVEIRDWVSVPDELGGEPDLKPSSGATFPLAELDDVIEALLAIKRDNAEEQE